MELLMRQHEELARLLLDPSDGERGQIGTRLFDELETLPGERDERIALREALALNVEAQRHQQLLIHELNHRVKNTLAIIQSIAMQTLRGHDTLREVQEAFMSRLMALADAHDILTAENWDSAELGHVLTHAVGMHRPINGLDRISLAGPAVRLEPKSAVAVAVAMATHELATNAARYGALSSDTGSIAVSWEIEESPEAPLLKLTWTERGGPPVATPVRRGFGSRLIERGLAGELNGTARLDFQPDGLVCTIEAPLPVVGASA